MKNLLLLKILSIWVMTILCFNTSMSQKNLNTDYNYQYNLISQNYPENSAKSESMNTKYDFSDDLDCETLKKLISQQTEVCKSTIESLKKYKEAKMIASTSSSPDENIKNIEKQIIDNKNLLKSTIDQYNNKCSPHISMPSDLSSSNNINYNNTQNQNSSNPIAPSNINVTANTINSSANAINSTVNNFNNINDEKNAKLNAINQSRSANTYDGRNVASKIEDYNISEGEKNIFDNTEESKSDLINVIEYQIGSTNFSCCNKEYKLSFTVKYEQQPQELNKIVAGLLDNTSIKFDGLDKNKIEEIKISYRLSLNLGEQSRLKEIALTKDNINNWIDIGASRFRNFTIESVRATCNPHFQGENQIKTMMSTDNKLKIIYTVTYLKRTGVETAGFDYYKVEGYLTNHYNKTIESTYIAGTLSFGLNLVNIIASDLPPERAVAFKIENASVIAGCNFPIPDVKMPVVVLKKE